MTNNVMTGVTYGNVQDVILVSVNRTNTEEVAKWKKGLNYNVYVQLHVCLEYEKIPSIDTVLILY